MNPQFYGTVSALRDYFEARGTDLSDSFTDEVAEKALLVASEWLDQKYRSSWPGDKKGLRDDQTRDWPRFDVYDVNYDYITSDIVPVEIEQATYEAAIKHFESPGILYPDHAPNKYTEVSVQGAVSVKYNSFDNASQTATKFGRIESIMSVFLNRYGGGGSVSSLSGPASRA